MTWGRVGAPVGNADLRPGTSTGLSDMPVTIRAANGTTTALTTPAHGAVTTGLPVGTHTVSALYATGTAPR